MLKLPPIEKIPEAYSAIVDNRVVMHEDNAIVKSSNLTKEYLVKWHDNIYYANDNATYWQGYLGYPVIAVLMLQGKLTYNADIAKYFSNVNWHQLNKDNKRDYQKSVAQILASVSADEQALVYAEINQAYEQIKNLDIELTKKKI